MSHLPVRASVGCSLGLAAALALVLGNVVTTDGNALPRSKYLVENPPKRIALVIGNAKYQGASTLSSPYNDAEKIRRTLKQLEFSSVTVLPDVKSVDQFTKAFIPFLSKIDEGSFVVVFYSGHGFSYRGESYLVPTEAPSKISETDIKFSFISAATIKSKIEEKKPGFLLLLLDACRNQKNIAERIDGPGKAEVTRGFSEIATRENALVWNSTVYGDESLEQEKMSYFTEAASLYIRQVDAESREVERLIRNSVLQNSKQKQMPTSTSTLSGRVYFKASEKLRSEFREAWATALRRKTVAEVTHFLDEFRVSPYEKSARRWLSENARRKYPPNFTFFSPLMIEDAWTAAASAGAANPKPGISVLRVTGPLRFDRVIAARGKFKAVDGKLFSEVSTAAEIFQRTGEILIFENIQLAVYPQPSPAGDPRWFGMHDKLAVIGVVNDQENEETWLKVDPGKGESAGYLRVPSNVDVKRVELGQPLKELFLGARDKGLLSLVDTQPLQSLAGICRSIKWVSIAVPETDSSHMERILNARALNAALKIAELCKARGKMEGITTIVRRLKFDGTAIRVRIVGKDS